MTRPRSASGAVYGEFSGAPSREELERFFFLDDADKARVATRRSASSRLGFALQLGTVWFLGVFLNGAWICGTNTSRAASPSARRRLRT